MFCVKTAGSCSLRIEHAPVQMPLISVVQVGSAGMAQALRAALQDLERTCGEAWALRVDRQPLTDTSLRSPTRNSSADTDVLCVFASTNDNEDVGKVRGALEASTARVKFLMLPDSQTSEPFACLKGLVNACFISGSLDLLLSPLRWISVPHGGIGIDMDDYMTVCAGRWVYADTIAISDLKDVIRARLPFQGLALSFGEIALEELDGSVDGVKALLPDEIDLIWHDASWRADSDTVDVCFAYDNPIAMRHP